MNSSIKILFSGDFAPCRRFEKVAIERKEKIFSEALEVIRNSDVSFVNLECPLTTSNETIEKSGPPLKADPETIDAIKVFTVAGLANNHILDYGRVGLLDTMDFCRKAGIKTVGAGDSLQASQEALILDAKGVKVAIIALAEHEFSQSEGDFPGAAPIDPIDNYWQIKKARENADIVLITMHAGNEYFPYPRPGLRKTCRYFIDLGADAVICHHPHVPGAYENYNGKPIFYSIGNLIFDNKTPKKGWESGFFVQLKYDTKNLSLEGIEMFPYKQSVDVGGIKLLVGQEKEKFLDKIEMYRRTLSNETLYQNEWLGFVRQSKRNYIMRQYSPVKFKGMGFLLRRFPWLLGSIFGRRKMDLDRLNLIRCQSHLELLRSSLRFQLEERGK